MSNDNNQFDQPIAGHEYDGIKEFDNPLPMWWLWTFFGTIIFAFIYFIHYEMGAGPNLDQELKMDLATIKEVAAANSAAATTAGGGGEQPPAADDLNAVIADKARAAEGKTIFAGKCASCHGNEGQGLIGPNLTDKFWIHGSKPTDMVTVIAKGVLDKGMPPWETQMKATEINSVVAYIVSIKGTNPANPKPAQGVEDKEY